MDSLIAIESKFLSDGWNTHQDEEIIPLDRVFDSNYEIVGVFVADTLDILFENWRECQNKMSELKDPDRLPSRDLYLLFVVPEIDDHYDKLAEVLSNSHVCRKMCLETRHKPLDDGLAELPFFKNKLVAPDSEPSLRDPVVDSIAALSPELREDLSKRDKEFVLQKLIDGGYVDAPIITDAEEL